MAEPLKNFVNAAAVEMIGSMIRTAHRSFDEASFKKQATKSLDTLELLPRAKHIAAALRTHLPPDTKKVLTILIDSLPDVVPVDENHAFSSFIFLPHTVVIAELGPEEFELGMRANYEVTQRFTAEFSIRPFLMQHQDRTLKMLAAWTKDESHHVRRLVSEGTRPRLPWASRLPAFQRDPAPVIRLLENLKDDPSLYVRRSVANNLNDIGKDNPDVLFATARSWLKGASDARQWIVHHALRSSIKRGEKEAFAIMGYGAKPAVEIASASITPSILHIGGSVTIDVALHNSTKRSQHLLVDVQVHFVKSNGTTSPKVFKIDRFELLPGERRLVRKTISVKQHTTRTHYPGEHQVDLVLNAVPTTIGVFHLKGEQT